MKIFTNSPPAFAPILDLEGILTASEIKAIEAHSRSLSRSFPQFQWCVVMADLPDEVSLNLYGFWLLNACPLGTLESPKQRAWTVMLVVNARSQTATVVTGYSAEPCLSDEDWNDALVSMMPYWRVKEPTRAVGRFFKVIRQRLRLSHDRSQLSLGKRSLL
jgi:uncharacterized membrane protein YgcG